MVMSMFFLPAGRSAENPWKDRVVPALAALEKRPSVENYARALDAAFRADDWETGLRLADQARSKFPRARKLAGLVLRAYWRAGRLDQALALAEKVTADSADRVALRCAIEVALARGNWQRATQLARRLEKLRPRSTAEYFAVLEVRLARQELAGLADELRKACKLVDPANGYPDIYLAEMLAGLPEFFEQIGAQPINQVTRFGQVPMPQLMALQLPYCEATINGQGPYRLVIDTGGSITLSLDEEVARDLGLKSLGSAPIRGVGGTQMSQQALVERLELGSIECRRVMTRWFAMPEMMKGLADGIIGTGIFGDARLTFDFAQAQLRVARSGPPPTGVATLPLLVVADGKLIVTGRIEGQPATALLDSGAQVVAFSPLTLKRLFPDQQPTSLQVAGAGVGQGEATGLTLGPGADLELWGRKFDNYSGIGLQVLDDTLSPIIGVQIDVLVGMPVFREMRTWTVDYPTRKMWLEWLE